MNIGEQPKTTFAGDHQKNQSLQTAPITLINSTTPVLHLKVHPSCLVFFFFNLEWHWGGLAFTGECAKTNAANAGNYPVESPKFYCFCHEPGYYM